MAEVAMLGAGRMGAAMVRRLVSAGCAVVVWNRTRSAADDLVASLGEGSVRVAYSPAEAVSTAEFVLVMLASGVVTEAVLLTDDVLAALPSGVVVCDMGTSGVSTALALDGALRAAGHRFVDAPVSGSVPTAAAGQLLIMAGGDATDIAALAPVLDAFAKQVIRVGSVGAGQAMKLSVNLVVHDLNAAVSEALVMATRAGISADAAYDVLQTSVVGAPFVQYKRAAFLDEETPVAMSLELSAKDLGLITAFADELGLSTPATRAVHGEVTAACAAGYQARDMADLFRYLVSECSTPI